MVKILLQSRYFVIVTIKSWVFVSSFCQFACIIHGSTLLPCVSVCNVMLLSREMGWDEKMKLFWENVEKSITTFLFLGCCTAELNIIMRTVYKFHYHFSGILISKFQTKIQSKVATKRETHGMAHLLSFCWADFVSLLCWIEQTNGMMCWCWWWYGIMK